MIPKPQQINVFYHVYFNIHEIKKNGYLLVFRYWYGKHQLSSGGILEFCRINEFRKFSFHNLYLIFLVNYYLDPISSSKLVF